MRETKLEKLERLCQELSSELRVVSSEKNSLIDLSNKLKTDVARLVREREENIRIKDAIIDDSIEDLDIPDLAQSLWSKAINGSNTGMVSHIAQ